MTTAELSRIDKSIEIAATPERVWRALTSAEELSSWFQVEIEGDLTAGSSVWMTSVHVGHVGQRFNVRVLEMTPPRRLVWAWHPGEVDPRLDYAHEPRTTVSFELEPFGTGNAADRVGNRFRRHRALAAGQGLRRQHAGLDGSPRVAPEVCGKIALTPVPRPTRCCSGRWAIPRASHSLNGCQTTDRRRSRCWRRRSR